MIRAGIWPFTGLGYEQAVTGLLEWPAMPEECGMRYARSALGEIQMLRGGHWVKTYHTATGWRGLKGGRARVRTGGGHPDAPGGNFTYNTCAGGNFHKVRIRLTAAITRPALTSVEARRVWIYPVTVHGSCARAALSERRVHRLQEGEFGSTFAAVLGLRQGALDQTTPLPPAPPLSPEERQECVNIAVNGIMPAQTPVGKRPVMYRAGIRPNTPGLPRNDFEGVTGGYLFEQMPEGSEPGQPDCTGIHRLSKTVLQMESAKHRGRFWWIEKLGPSPEPHFPHPKPILIGVQWGATGSEVIFNRCPDGKHWHKVREKVTLYAKDGRTGAILPERHTYTWPVPVRGSCAAAARSARLVNGFGVRK